MSFVEMDKNSINYKVNDSGFVKLNSFEEINSLKSDTDILESGIYFSDENDTIRSIYQADSLDESKKTMLKVMSVAELDDEQRTKVQKIMYIIKESLKIMFKNKISVFLLSSAFIYMSAMGFKEKLYFVPLAYTWAFFMITKCDEAYRYFKEMITLYKINEEALNDTTIMEFIEKEFEDDENLGIGLYLIKK